MKTIREVLNTIKMIKGVGTDAELARLIDVPIDTLRGWIQNDSIRRQLMLFCYNNNISIDEVFFGERIFNKKRCIDCMNKHKCPIYLKMVNTPINIEETENRIQLKLLTKNEYQFSCKVINSDDITTDLSITKENVDKIIINLEK